MLNLFGDSLKVILKYYLLPITSILMFKYFVQTTTVYMFGRRRLLCKTAGCYGDIMSFTSSVKKHFCLTRLCCTNFIKYKTNEKNIPCKVIIFSCFFEQKVFRNTMILVSCHQYIYTILPNFLKII